MRLAPYGIDAPGLLLAFAGAALGLLAAGGALLAWGPAWAAVPGGLLLVLALYPVGMTALMLVGSLVTKVRGREAILDLVAWRGDEAVLDVGCGRGLMLVGAAHRLGTGRAVGVDIWLGRDQAANGPEAALANARAEGVADRVRVETADMRRLPFPDASFDVVLSSWAVHNLDAAADRDRALAEMARVLRPGGTILLTDIVHREAYLAGFKRLGLGALRLVVPSPRRDRLLSAVTFGSFQPATVVARAA